MTAVWGCISAMQLIVSLFLTYINGLTMAYIRNPSFPSSAILPQSARHTTLEEGVGLTLCRMQDPPLVPEHHVFPPILY